MSRVKVSLFKTSPARSVSIDPDATKGATIGENVYNADGTLFDPAQTVETIINEINEEGGEGTGISLDDVEIDGDGLVDVDGSVAQGAVDIGLDLARAWMFAA
jgi:hypothetical protein